MQQIVRKRKEYQKEYQRANKEKIAAQSKEYYKKHYKANKEKLAIQSKKYKKNNKEKIAIQSKKYREANKKKIVAQNKKYRKANLKKIKAQKKEYREANKEKLASQKKEYREVDPKKYKAICKRSYEKRKLEPGFCLNQNMSSGIKRSLKTSNGKNGKCWKDILPYTIDDLIKRLKKTLPSGYTWNDYINGKTDLHIDHKIPLAVHNFKSYTDTDFQRCWALKNLQLLPAKDNMSKGAKLIKPFQPSLLL